MRAALAFAGVCLTSLAAAHGRFPATTAVRVGDDGALVVATTFGLVVSRALARWGRVVAVTAGGAWLVTTYDGLRVSRDGGCTWATATDLVAAWVADVTVGPDGAVWAAAAQGGQQDGVWVSRDDARSFAPAGFDLDGWLRSVRVAPSDAGRVYATGARLAGETPDGGAPAIVDFLLRGDDAAWTMLPIAREVGEVPLLLGVSPTDPEVVFPRIDGQRDALRVSRDGGAHWDTAFTVDGDLDAFVALVDGVTALAGPRISRNGGSSSEPRALPLACAAAGAGGAILGCGGDDFAVGTSRDGTRWAPLLRLADVAGPPTCAAESPVSERCVPLWAVVAPTLQPLAVDAGVPGAAAAPSHGGGGGCGVGLAAVLLWPLRRRR